VTNQTFSHLIFSILNLADSHVLQTSLFINKPNIGLKEIRFFELDLDLLSALVINKFVTMKNESTRYQFNFTVYPSGV